MRACVSACAQPIQWRWLSHQKDDSTCSRPWRLSTVGCTLKILSDWRAIQMSMARQLYRQEGEKKGLHCVVRRLRVYWDTQALKPLINWTNIGRKCVQVWQSFYLTVVIQYSIVHICPQLHSCYTEATCTFSLSLWKLKTNIYLQLFQWKVFNFVGFFKNIFNGSGC